MIGSLIYTATFVACAAAAEDLGRIEGVVVNGSVRNTRLAGVAVVLRAGDESFFMPVAQTVTDEEGRFSFEEAPIEPGLIYLPGANRGGVHYPGPRIELRREAPSAHVTVTVYDAVASPSPLVAEEYDIEVEIETGAMQVTETLLVSNPSNTAFVGETVGEAPPVTLRLSIPEGYERVTFFDEFHGRRFYVAAGHVVTNIPWPPGERKLKYTYRLPIAEQSTLFQRTLDIPCSRLGVIVRGADADDVECNLPDAKDAGEGSIAFVSTGGRTTPAGFEIQLRLGRLPTPWMAYARWGSLGFLAVLMLGTTWFYRRRKPPPASQAPRADSRQRAGPGGKRKAA